MFVVKFIIVDKNGIVQKRPPKNNKPFLGLISIFDKGYAIKKTNAEL